MTEEPLLPPRVVNLSADASGIALGRGRSTVLRCPCTYPPDKVRADALGMRCHDCAAVSALDVLPLDEPSSPQSENLVRVPVNRRPEVRRI